MLLITFTETIAMGRQIKLEGKLREPWLEEVQKVCNPGGDSPGGLHLDLSSLTFIDAASVQWLHGVIRQGATVTACSPFVAAMMNLRQP
jgi:hypothetical protein